MNTYMHTYTPCRSTEECITSAVSLVEGVTEVVYVENGTWDYDYVTLLPPMSFRVAVRGGKKKAIARAIWNNKTVGIMSCGDTEVTIKDSYESIVWNVRFQRIPKGGES